MNVYGYCIEQICNIVLVGYVGSGKIILFEVLLFVGGVIQVFGLVECGNMFFDIDVQEKVCGYLIDSCLVVVMCGDCCIQLIDMFGYVDFCGLVLVVLVVVDMVVVVVNVVNGIEYGIWCMVEYVC